MLKSNKITRRAFILKTSKAICGYMLLPVVVTSLTKCDALIRSEDCDSSELYSECPCHGARFNIEGEVVKQPYVGSADSPLKKYQANFSDKDLLIIDPQNQENSFTINIDDFPEISDVGGYIDLESNEIDGTGFLIYRKSNNKFTVLSRECTHAGCPVDPFTNPLQVRNETSC